MKIYPETDADGQYFTIPIINEKIHAGESVALIGVRESDISSIFQLLHENTGALKRNKNVLTVHGVKRKSDLFTKYSAIENCMMAEKTLIRYNRNEIIKLLNDISVKFNLEIDFNENIRNLDISKQILIDVVRSMIIDPDIFVFDRLLNLLDYKSAGSFLAIADSLVKKNKYVMYFTTKWEDAVQLSTRIIVVMDGVVLGKMTSDQVRKDPHKLVYLLSGQTLIENHHGSEKTSDLLDMLYLGAEYFSDNLDIGEAMERLSKAITNAFHCCSTNIYLSDGSNGNIHCFSDSINNPERLCDSFIQHQLKDSSPLHYYTFETSGFYNFFENFNSRVKTILCAPITFRNHVKGLLQISFESYFLYTSEQLIALKSFCNEAALIIESSRLMGSSLLLQESNHRIKNNLQIIVNLVEMRSLYLPQNEEGEYTLSILENIISEIKSIAAVHELLSKDNSMSPILMNKLISTVSKSIDFSKIKFVTDSDGDHYIPYSKTNPIAMVINELIINSVKHAFPSRLDSRECVIKIETKEQNSNLVIAVSDNGTGFPKGFSLDKCSGLGYTIISTIVKNDLKGTLRVDDPAEGARVVITIPKSVLI
jgi:ribose transport system ATP-binding protein